VRLARRISSVGLVLTSIDFFDELASGLPSAGAPELRTALDASVAILTFVVFTAPQLFALLVDTPLLVWAERRGRGRMVGLGLFGMGLSLVLSGLARTPLEFALAFALYHPASGLACSFAQASLMDHDPERREQGMTAWVLAGTLGDLLAPVAIWGAVVLLGTFRGAWLVVGAVLMALAPLVARQKLPHTSPADDATEAGGTFRAALRNRPLLAWLVGVGLCGLLDETLTTFGALWLAERFPDSTLAVTAGLTACTAGGVIGLVALNRLLHRFSARLLLGVACGGSILLFGCWLSSTSILESTLWLFPLGILIAWHYPLAQAQAYRAADGRSGQVVVLGPLTSALELASPVALGLLADRGGLTFSLVALLAQPFGLLLVLYGVRRKRPATLTDSR
jgi:MFS transporter, FSR family, fosmidomycin resistance protein